MAKFAFNSSFYREEEENFHSITCENREQYKYEAKYQYFETSEKSNKL